jgi:glycosyltransferase involved in cell wall biosynthesis
MGVTGGPTVTIAIPTYNRVRTYLPQSLGSALRQGYPHVEIVVSDNGSTDGTKEYVTGLGDSRVRYHGHANLGAIGNFDYCVRVASGDYFLLLCDDDMIDDDFVETCMRAAAYRADVGLVRTGTRVLRESTGVAAEHRNETVGLDLRGYVQAWLDGRVQFYPCSVLLNTNVLRRTGSFGTHPGVACDVAAQLVVAAERGRVDVADVKATYRRHGGEISETTKLAEWCDSHLYVSRLIGRYASDLQGAARVGFLKRACQAIARGPHGMPSRLSSYRAAARCLNVDLLQGSLLSFIMRLEARRGAARIFPNRGARSTSARAT